ncbi:MAG: hypothetical protein ABL998_07170 [Planctomycetota bacterium]
MSAVSLEFERAGVERRLQADSQAEARVSWGGEGLRLERWLEHGGLGGCLVCAHPELYTQRDFPRALGLGIVVLAAVLAPFTNYLSLVAAALFDALLYRLAPTLVACYVCGARHRGFAPEPRHPRYDLTIAERLRYGPKAVMGAPMRSGGTAGAPEPEH